MKFIPLKRSFLSLCLMASMGTTYADDQTSSDILTALNTISGYIQNLGMYFGYDVTGYCNSGGSCGGSSSSASPSSAGSSSSSSAGSSFSNQLTPLTTTNVVEDTQLFSSFLGAILPNIPTSSSSNPSTFQLVPTSLTADAWLNPLANHAISTSNSPYSSPSTTLPSVNPLVDQGQQGSTYQFDPVNQSILNILSTPDVSYCTDQNNDANNGGLMTNCTLMPPKGTVYAPEPVLSQVQVMLNTIGVSFDLTSYAAPTTFLSPTQNATLVNQLNSDSLIGPLMFDPGSTANTPASNTAAGQGLIANDQVQQAANFIRYATGSVTPPTQPNQTAYTNLYTTAMGGGNITPAAQLNAQSIIANYLASIRVYAAQTSVGISNMYYILSKRMPQKPTSDSSSSTPLPSQALNEFNMATWRLAPPQSGSASTSNPTWLTQINSASSATVEKEIAILLAEINYQLYLNRSMQERQLLTESTLLLLSARNAQPKSDLTQSPAATNSPPMAAGN